MFSLLFLSYRNGTSEVYTLYIYTLSGNVHSNTVMFLSRVEMVEKGESGADNTFKTYVVLAVETVLFYCLLVFFIGKLYLLVSSLYW